MNRRRLVCALILTILFLMAFTGAAYAGTIKLTLVMNPMNNLTIDGMGRQVYIYGPNGYYRSTWAPWPGAYQKQTLTFTGAPDGAYRFRVYSPFYRRDTNNAYPTIKFTVWNAYTYKYSMLR